MKINAAGSWLGQHDDGHGRFLLAAAGGGYPHQYVARRSGGPQHIYAAGAGTAAHSTPCYIPQVVVITSVSSLVNTCGVLAHRVIAA